MKKYELKDLEESLLLLSSLAKNEVISEFKEKIEAEITKRGKHFEKATDEYLATLTRADIYKRLLVPTDKHYYKGMYGMFERATDKLLRRHTDLGFLKLP